MKHFLAYFSILFVAVLSSCEAFEDGTVSAYDYAGYTPYYYNPPFYENYPYYNPWNSPVYNPIPPAIPNRPPIIGNIPVRPQQPQRPIVSPNNPQAPSFNGTRPGSRPKPIMPRGDNNNFGAEKQDWTTIPSGTTGVTNGGRRPGSR